MLSPWLLGTRHAASFPHGPDEGTSINPHMHFSGFLNSETLQLEHNVEAKFTRWPPASRMLEKVFFFCECFFKLETDAAQADPSWQPRDLIQTPNVFEKNSTEAIKMDKCPHLLPIEWAPMSILDRLHHSLPFQSDRTLHMVMYCLLSGPLDVIFLTAFSPPGRYWRWVWSAFSWTNKVNGQRTRHWVSPQRDNSVIKVHCEFGGQKGYFIFSQRSPKYDHLFSRLFWVYGDLSVCVHDNVSFQKRCVVLRTLRLLFQAAQLQFG